MNPDIILYDLCKDLGKIFPSKIKLLLFDCYPLQSDFYHLTGFMLSIYFLFVIWSRYCVEFN